VWMIVGWVLEGRLESGSKRRVEEVQEMGKKALLTWSQSCAQKGIFAMPYLGSVDNTRGSEPLLITVYKYALNDQPSRSWFSVNRTTISTRGRGHGNFLRSSSLILSTYIKCCTLYMITIWKYILNGCFGKWAIEACAIIPAGNIFTYVSMANLLVGIPILGTSYPYPHSHGPSTTAPMPIKMLPMNVRK
jgi:hypothetical protein